MRRRHAGNSFPWITKTTWTGKTTHAVDDTVPSMLYSDSKPSRNPKLYNKGFRSSFQGYHGHYTDFVSVRTKPAPKTNTAPHHSSSNEVAKAYVTKETWSTLSGNEFSNYDTLHKLSKTAIQLCHDETHPDLEWKPDKETEQILHQYGPNGSSSLSYALRHTLPPTTILVWTAKFQPSRNAYGSQLPLLRTRGIVSNMTPRAMTSLLMDSSKVQSYNQMSLGRTDDVVFQAGIDSLDGDFGDGESKIVVNLTKPPLVKKLLEFRTLMHARKLRPPECGEEEGYVIVSRAVPGSSSSEHQEERIRSEILMGANLLRSIPGTPEHTDVTSVTHVNSPLVHPMVAGKIGRKGAIDFLNDMRAMGKKQ